MTGGGGFLGRAIVARLQARGDEVTVLARRPQPDMSVKLALADLTDRLAVQQACQDQDCVFHVAAKAGLWGSWTEYYESNVLGTFNVLDGCRTARVPRLVYTSSPSVTFAGRDHCGADESLPYPGSFLNFYSETKALAEQEVLAANSPELATVALRPHLIWGPGDPHILPRLVKRARAGRLVRVGPGGNRVDITYVDNAAQAHLQAADRLEPGSPVAGKAYFLSNDEPVELWPWIDDMLGRLGAPPVRRTLPLGAAQLLGSFLEWLYRLARLPGEPPMTRFLAAQLGTSHWYNIAAARRDFGYEPEVSVAEGMERVVAAWPKN